MYKTFVSFDYDNDRQYKFLLGAWNKNPQFQFTFLDHSAREIMSNDVGRVKAALANRIREADYTLVIVGQYADLPHRDRALIGHRNWTNFEIAKSKKCRNQLVAIKIESRYETPSELLGAGAKWAMSFTEEGILKALRGW